jgi:hypothetical protein
MYRHLILIALIGEGLHEVKLTVFAKERQALPDL